jgi:hypothetical protein
MRLNVSHIHDDKLTRTEEGFRQHERRMHAFSRLSEARREAAMDLHKY